MNRNLTSSPLGNNLLLRTDSYKVSISYRDGFMSSGTLVLTAPNAVAKAEACGEILLNRLKRCGAEPEHYNTECLGAGAAGQRQSEDS